MILPALPDFDSRDLPAGGRLYCVHRRTHCVAYPIEDRDTLRQLGAVDGLIVYAFVELDARQQPRKLGVWYCAMHADDLREALETMRAALDPSAPRTQHRSLAELVEERLGRRAQLRIDIDVDTGG